MRLVVTETERIAWYVSRSVCLSVCLSDTVVNPAKTAEPIDMPFGCRLNWVGWAQGTMQAY